VENKTPLSDELTATSVTDQGHRLLRARRRSTSQLRPQLDFISGKAAHRPRSEHRCRKHFRYVLNLYRGQLRRPDGRRSAS